jgi:hypothetical protein
MLEEEHPECCVPECDADIYQERKNRITKKKRKKK